MEPTWVDRARDFCRGLVVRESPDPRAAQTLFLLLVLSDLVLRAPGLITTDEILREPTWPLAGLTIVLVAQVLASITPWSRTSESMIVALPILDIAGIGLLRLNPEASGAGILAAVPAVWMVWQYGLRGVVMATVACLGAMAFPAILYFGFDGATLSRSILDPSVAALMAGVAWALLTTARQVGEEAARRSHELADALQQLRHTRAFADAIFESVDVGLILLGRDGDYLAMNQKHKEFMALAFPDGHHGKAGQLGEVYAEDGIRPLAKHEMPSYRASRGEEFDDVRLWVGADPLTRRACSVSARAVVDPDGSFVGAAMAYKDVTHFLRSMGVKDEFVAMVSHEFRTPLTSIHGYVNLMLEEDDGRLSPENTHYLRVVARNTERLTGLVSELLSSAEHRPMEIDRTPTNISEVVRASVESARPQAESKDLTMTVEAPTDLRIMVDALRFGQVVDNLVSNAVKYTPEGGRIDITLAGYAEHVELRVRDTGIGIDPAERDRLFTRFFRTKDAEERSIPGVGLGLSITKKIVETHGGRIEVESSSEGSTFLVWLPLDLVTSDDQIQAQEELEVLEEIGRVRAG